MSSTVVVHSILHPGKWRGPNGSGDKIKSLIEPGLSDVEPNNEDHFYTRQIRGLYDKRPVWLPKNIPIVGLYSTVERSGILLLLNKTM